MRGGGGGDVAVASAPIVAPFESPDICETPPEISPLLMQRLPVVEPRSFSDSSSYQLLFFLVF